MSLPPWQRLVKEAGLGVLAIVAALLVDIPALVIVNLLFNVGLYTLLVSIVIIGVALLVYQARIRPRLR
ncbi:MAG: hypothetical protein ACR2PL_07775 [Dehalococcoidia bacterium]